jgi:hypothetical protein
MSEGCDSEEEGEVRIDFSKPTGVHFDAVRNKGESPPNSERPETPNIRRCRDASSVLPAEPPELSFGAGVRYPISSFGGCPRAPVRRVFADAAHSDEAVRSG